MPNTDMGQSGIGLARTNYYRNQDTITFYNRGGAGKACGENRQILS